MQVKGDPRNVVRGARDTPVATRSTQCVFEYWSRADASVNNCEKVISVSEMETKEKPVIAAREKGKNIFLQLSCTPCNYLCTIILSQGQDPVATPFLRAWATVDTIPLRSACHSIHLARDWKILVGAPCDE